MLLNALVSPNPFLTTHTWLTSTSLSTNVPWSFLLCGCEYLELDEVSYKKSLFEKIVDKNIKYNKIKITKTVDKSTITHNKKDQGTLVDNEVEVSQVWVVKNGIGLTKAFNSMDKALELVNELNNKYLEMAELK